METLNIVISEILLCLALAWALGFLAAWILFRKVQNEYEEEIEELEENLSYASASNKNQEREITQQTLKIQEFAKLLKTDRNNILTDKSAKKESSKEKAKKSIIKNNSKDIEMLKLIDDNLYTPKKK